MYDKCVNTVCTIFLLIVVYCCNREMAGRNDTTIVDALEALAHVLQAQQNSQIEGAESHGLNTFQRNKTPTFKGRYDLEGAQVWLQEIKKIFRVMAYANAQKVAYGTHMLSEEVEYWWDNDRQTFETNCIVITWNIFRGTFLKNISQLMCVAKRRLNSLNLSKGI